MVLEATLMPTGDTVYFELESRTGNFSNLWTFKVIPQK